MREHYNGPINGSIPYDNHNKLPLAWTLVQPSDKFSIDILTGVISVIYPGGLTFVDASSGIPPGVTPTGGQYNLAVSLMDARNPGFGSIAQVVIDVVDVNSPPVQSNYTYYVLPGDLNPGTMVGLLTNNDPDSLSWEIVGTRPSDSKATWQFDRSTILYAQQASVFASFMAGWAAPDPVTPSFFAFDPTTATPATFPVYPLLLARAAAPASLTSMATAGGVFAYQATGSSAIYLASNAVKLTLASSDSAGETSLSAVTVVFLNTNFSSNVQVTSVSPSAALPTPGGTILTVSFSGLSSAVVDFNITVGSATSTMGPRVCTIVSSSDPATALPIPRDDFSPGVTWAQNFLQNYPSPLLQPPPISSSSTWNVFCLLPPGEGTAPITIQYTLSQAPTLVLSSGELGALALTYAPPGLTALSAWQRGNATGTGSRLLCPLDAQYAQAFAAGTSTRGGGALPACGQALLVPPSMHGVLEGDGSGGLLRTARLEGSNFGVCPVVNFFLPSGALKTSVATCTPTSPGEPLAGVMMGHTFIEFPAPEGVGGGVGAGAAGCPTSSGCGTGWTFSVSAGGQATPPLPLHFLPPLPLSITPSTGITAGGLSVVIRSDFLGPYASAPVWYAGTPGWASTPCVALGYALPGVPAPPFLTTFPASQPRYDTFGAGGCSAMPNTMACTRTAVDELTCVTPNGAGANLPVVIWVDGATVGVGVAGSSGSGSGGALFSYTPPTLTGICTAQLTSGSAWLGSGSPQPPAYTTTACIAPTSPPGQQVLTLPGLPTNADVLVFTGSSLGPAIASDCAFSAFAPTLSPCVASGLPTCPPSGSTAPCCRVGGDGSTPWGSAQGLSALQCLSFPPGLSAGSVSSSSNASSGAPIADFPGEGQVAPIDVLHWGDSVVVVRSPPGAGQRLLTLRATGQAPSPWPSETALNAQYAPPVISGALAVPFGGGSTNGGGRAFIPATNAPRMPYTEWFNATTTHWVGVLNLSLAQFSAGGLPASGYLMPPYPSRFLPLPLPLLPPGSVYNNSGSGSPPHHRQQLGWQEATETLVVWVGSHCLVPPSLAQDYVAGGPSSALAQCSMCSAASGVGCVVEADTAGVSFVVPPGVGRNKPVRLGYLSARDNGFVGGGGGNLSALFPSLGSFSYSPPLITNMGTLNPVTQTITQPVVYNGGDAIISVTGLNFGVPVYQGPGQWDATELALAVGVAAFPCSAPARGFSANPAIGNYVYCILLARDLAQLSVGFNGAFITIGAPPLDQTGVLPVGAPNSLYIACEGGALPATPATYGSLASGTFGFVGQSCMPCPVGALCPGYVEDENPLGVGGTAAAAAAAAAASSPASGGRPTLTPNPCGLGMGAQGSISNCIGNISSAWTAPCCLSTDPTTPEGALWYARALPPVPTNYTLLWSSWQGVVLGGGATWAGQVVVFDAARGAVGPALPFSPQERAGAAEGVAPFPTSRLQYDRLVVPVVGGALVPRTIAHSLPIPQAGFFNLNGTMAAVCPPMAFVRDNVCIVACTPSIACQVDNVCAPPYRSLPPTFRCSSWCVGAPYPATSTSRTHAHTAPPPSHMPPHPLPPTMHTHTHTHTHTLSHTLSLSLLAATRGFIA